VCLSYTRNSATRTFKQETRVPDNADAATCEVGTPVIVSFVGRQALNRDDTSGPIFHQANDLLIVVGDKDCIPALEMGIRFLREGSRGVVYSHSKYAYGNLTRVNGDYELPPNSNVVYDLQVKKIVLDASDTEIAASRKQIANDCYKNEWSNGLGKSRPLYLYKKAADAMNNVLVNSPDDQAARGILVDCLNNTAALHLRAKEYGKAKEAATLVLVQDPDNVKALCRAARAAMLDPAGSYEESEAAIATAENLKPEDPDVIKMRAELTRRKRDYKKKSKAAFSKLGASTVERETPMTKKQDATSEKSSDKTTDTTRPSEDRSSDNTTTPESRSWYDIAKPMILQMVVSFIALFIFQYMAKQHDVESLELKRRLEDMGSSESEF
jgi:tetratricopeptide (TPR) repeat protein